MDQIRDLELSRVLRASKKRCEDIAEKGMVEERATYGKEEFKYGAYMGGVFSYFSDTPRGAPSFQGIADVRELVADKEKREQQGEKLACLDFFGPGFIGHDLKYARIFSADLVDHPSYPQHTHFSKKNLLDARYQLQIFKTVAEAVRAERISVHRSFIRPYGGLDQYRNEPYAYVSFAHLVSGIYKLMSHGEILFECTRFEPAVVDRWVQDLRERGFSIEQRPGMSVYVLEKNEDSPDALPDMVRMLQVDNELKRLLLSVEKRD